MSRKTPPLDRPRFESLEHRTLLAGETWGPTAKLIRQDEAVAQFASIDGSGQAIAILDTGIDYTHTFLGNGFGTGHKVVGGYDFVDNDSDPMDTYGHGTRVAGIIAADPFLAGGMKYQGVAPDAKLLALRVDAANDPVPDSRIESALKWVLDHRTQYNIVAVNISFGSGHYSGDQTSPTYSDELAQLVSAGVFIAAASGNGGVTEPFGVEFPAADPSAFAVGSVDQYDRITEFTERGPGLDIVAPGESVPTTGLGPSNFEGATGTSYSVPFIAGAIALLKQANPDLKVGDERSILRAAGVDNLDGDSEFGTVTNLTFPRLDLVDSIKLAKARATGPLSSTGEVATGGNSNDMKFDRDGVLHIAYYDSVAKKLKYATRSTDRKLAKEMTIDASDGDFGQYVSLAVNEMGRPSVAYFDATRGDLKYAAFDGVNWSTQTLDSSGSVGLYPSLIFDTTGNPIISYYQKTKGDLRIARFDGTNWTIQALDAKGDVGRSTSMAISKSGEIAIAYEHSTLGVVKIARNAGSAWSLGAVDMNTLGAAFMSLAFDAQNNPAVSYYDAFRSNLKFAHYNSATWDVQTLASKGAQGLYTKLVYDDSGQAEIIYYNRRSDLTMKITGAIPTWTVTVLQSGGGRFIGGALNHDTDSIAYSWFNSTDAKLRLADSSTA